MADRSVKRAATHAGSWYSSDKSKLSTQLDGWLGAVPSPVHCIGPNTQGQIAEQLPVPSARVIIAPHAGYSYSGPAAAWAYKSWDVSSAKRIFLLGPSHHFYLPKAALSRCTHYETPLGDLTVDRETTAELYSTGQFEWMSQSVDEDEHSLEMHLPYIFKVLESTFGSEAKRPSLVPIMIGNTSPHAERAIGRVLAPYLADPSNAFVVSSDFAHWGLRFRYTYYRPSLSSQQALNLKASAKDPRDPPIHESIRAVDFECMGACETGSHEEWLNCLEANGNTVCGRHPIGVMMAAVEEVKKTRGADDQSNVGRFQFVRYERSSEVKKVSDTSVSYASAYAVI